MKKLIILASIVILFAIIAGGYYWWQKRQTIIPSDYRNLVPEAEKVLCETLKDIPSVDYAPQDVRERFLECFPERATSPKPATSTPGATSAPSIQEQGPTCEQLKTIPSAQYAPPDVRDKFLKCFPERK